MPSPTPPIGSREGQHLEFKRAEALRALTARGGQKADRRQLLRSVVGMRNASGGEIWVGYVDKDGIAVGVDVLTDADRPLIEALRDSILDSVEPFTTAVIDSPPGEGEIRLNRVPVEGGWLLEIIVEAHAKIAPPSALRSGGSREFLIRVDARTAHMAYDEIAARFRVAKPAPESDLRSIVLDLHKDWIKAHSWAAGLAVTFAPLPLVDRESVPEEWGQLVTKPPPEIARPNGFTWQSPGSRVKQKRGRISSGEVDRDVGAVYRSLRIEPSGAVHFFTDFRSLEQAPTREAEQAVPGHNGEIDALALVESVASVIRLAASLPGSLSVPVTHVGAIASLPGADDWVLPLGHPHRFPRFLGVRDQWVLFNSQPPVTSDVRLWPRDRFPGPEAADSLSYAVLLRLYESDLDTADIVPGAIPWFPEPTRFAPG